MAEFLVSNLKSTLNNCIAVLYGIHHLFCVNPHADFTRNRKISFQDYIRFMIHMQSKSMSNEVMDFFGHTVSAPTKSAFAQQRYKFLPEG